MDASRQETRWLNRTTEVIILLAILLVAAAFRLVQLGEVPPGLTHDEADHGMDAVAILNGARPIYETVGYGREPLYDYVVAALMPIFGQSYLALRLTSVLAGLLLIVVMHLWVRRAFDAPTALWTSALLAVSFWAVSTDRQALRSALLPALFSVSVFFAWQALSASGTPSASGVSASGDASYRASGTPSTSAPSIRVIRARIRVRWVNYGMAGLFLGLSLYTYMAARVLPGVFVVLWFYLLLFHRQVWKQHWQGIIVIVALGVGLSLPMFAYLAANPGSEARLSQLSGPIDRLFAGEPSDILGNTLGALGMFTLKGDDLWLYNIPGRPLLDGVTGILFFLGAFIAVRRFRRIEYALALFWLLAGIFPSLLTGVTASSLRSIVAQPVVYLLVAIAAVEAMRSLPPSISCRRGKGRGWGAVRVLPLVALLAATAISTAHDYFAVWGQARDVRVAYHTTLFEIARYLDRAAEPNAVVAISSIYPERYHDPYAMAMTLTRKDLSLRWFTGSFVDMFGVPHASLVFPRGQGQARSLPWVITQAVAPVDAAFAGLFAAHAEKTAAIDLRPDDFNPRFEVYRFDAERAVREALESATRLPGSASFDGALRLLGYDIRTPQARPGDTVEVMTYWQFTSPVPFGKQAVLFTHVLTGDPGRPVLAQQDSLDVPLESLASGDVFAQVHRFVIPPDAAPGAYSLEVGVYTREDGARLPVRDESGALAGDHVIIGSIEIVVP